MISKFSRISIVTLILFTFTAISFADTNDWREYKSIHFIISYHPSIPSTYIRGFTRKCEQYYSSIAERLGLRRFDFWTWDNRARIVVYDTHENYIKDRARPQWSAASVYVKDKLISTYCFEEEFFDSILAHEITHIILREFIGLDTEVPLWFEEGVACVNEQAGQRYLSLAQEQPLLVKAMEQLTSSQALDKISGLNIPDLPGRFYATSASLVLFLQKYYPQANFTQLCRHLRAGNTFSQALHKAYRLKGAQDLEAQFLSYLSHQ